MWLIWLIAGKVGSRGGWKACYEGLLLCGAVVVQDGGPKFFCGATILTFKDEQKSYTSGG